MERDFGVRLAIAARQFFPGVSVPTLHRWRIRGIKDVRRECQKVGGRWFVTREAAEKFITGLTMATKTRGTRSSDRVEQQLDRIFGRRG